MSLVQKVLLFLAAMLDHPAFEWAHSKADKMIEI